MTPILGRPGLRSVCEVRLVNEGPDPEVSFRLVGPGGESPSLLAPAWAIGLPGTFADLLARREPPDFTIPESLRKELQRLFEGHHPHDLPLWLDLEAPARLAAVVPWERLLMPFAGDAVIRAPRLPLCPVRSRKVLRTVLCLSIPAGADLPDLLDIVGFLSRYDRTPKGEIRTRAFLLPELALDDDAAAVLHSHLTRAKLAAYVKVLEPPAADEAAGEPNAEGRPPAATVRNPWLRAVLREMRGSGVDVLQLVTKARLMPGSAALELGTRIIDDRPHSLLVDPVDFDLFLTQIGAWGVDLLPLGDAWSAPALRVFADALSWLAPLEIAVHGVGSGGFELAASLGVRAGAVPLWLVQAGSELSVHETGGSKDLAWGERPQGEVGGLEHCTLARGELREILEEGAGAGWFMAVQRHLERQVALLLRQDFLRGLRREREATDLYEERRKGTVEGLQTVVTTVTRYLNDAGVEQAFDPEVIKGLPVAVPAY